jgi:hypothetical protein
MICSYMDAPVLQGRDLCFGEQARLQSYIRPVVQADSPLAMMESAGEVLYFATSSRLLSRFRLVSPRSDLFHHHSDLYLRKLIEFLSPFS